MTEATRSAPAIPALTAEDVARAARLAVDAERERSAAIRRTARAFELAETLADEHIGKGSTPDAFRKVAEDAHAEKPPVTRACGIPIVAGEDAREKFVRGATDWLLVRSGVAGLVADAAKRRGETITIDPGEFKGCTYRDLARQALELRGVSTKRLTPNELFARALTFREGMQTTGDFPIALENALNKTLLAAYAVAPDTWRRFCRVGSVPDFRASPRYRLGALGALQPLNEGGEFENVALSDAEKESISAATKGYIIAFTRKLLIDDDMSVFSSIATMMGRAAARTIERDVYALISLAAGLGPLMTDAKRMFNADHNNIGTGSALTVAGLEADRLVMALQTDPSGNEFLDLKPAIIVVPLALEAEARLLNTAEFDVDSSVNENRPNLARGLFRDVIGTARLSGTRRYLFADPADVACVEVVFLDGQQAPYLETQDGWRVDGTEYKVRLDFGVGGVDFRGCVTNAGAE